MDRSQLTASPKLLDAFSENDSANGQSLNEFLRLCYPQSAPVKINHFAVTPLARGCELAARPCRVRSHGEAINRVRRRGSDAVECQPEIAVPRMTCDTLLSTKYHIYPTIIAVRKIFPCSPSPGPGSRLILRFKTFCDSFTVTSSFPPSWVSELGGSSIIDHP
jgi:hypothetical protein